jgi:signal transduction histidine kinase
MINSTFQNNSEESVPINFNTAIDKLESLSDSSPLVVTDRELNVFYANSVFLKNFGVGDNNKINPINSDLDFSEIFSTFSSSVYSDFRFDLNIISTNNIKQAYSVDIEKVFLQNVEYFVIIFRSLEEKTQLEKRVIDFHNALEYGVVPLMILNENGRIRYSTKAFEEIFNTNIELIYNNYLSNILIDYLTSDDVTSLDNAIKKGEKFTKIVQVKKDNSVRYKELSVIPVTSEYDTSASFIVNANDITDYIIKNQLIQSSENKLKSIINNISDLLIILRAKKDLLVFESTNENFCRAFSLNKEDIISKEISTVFVPEITGAIRNLLAVSPSNASSDISAELPGSGNAVYKLKYSYIDDYEVNERLYIITFNDITVQKRFENQLQSAYRKEAFLNSLKTSFLENMSHEIRTPFNAIMGYSEIIEDCSVTGDYETIKELTLLVKDVLKRILNLFTNIVEVSQIESGEIIVEKETVNCSQIIKNIYDKKVKDAQVKNLLFHYEVEPEVFNMVTDPGLLDKAITPLVDNAIKYTETGSVKISSNIENDKYAIRIEDTGAGIDQKQIIRLLQPFTQEEEGYTRRYEGAGLGLTIAYKLIKLLDGEFNISSSKDVGTSITIMLPIQQGQA